jgi:hypothetical protein
MEELVWGTPQRDRNHGRPLRGKGFLLFMDIK